MTRARDLSKILPNIVTSGNFSVTGVSTVGLVTFTENVNFGDSDKLYFGDGNDLQIFHDGNNTFLHETGVGSLFVRSDRILIQTGAGVTYEDFKENGAVDLYYNGSKKFETTGFGVTVSGGLYVSGIATIGSATINSGTVTGITSVSTTNLTVNGNAYPATGPLSNRNKIINGNFDVWQRGTSFTSTVSGTSDYTADRWKAGGGTSTTVSRQAFTLGQTDVPGEPTYYARWAITNNSQNYEFQQRIEDVRTLAGQQATISFYARRTTGSITVGLRTVQYFGTGGSPSSSVVVSAGTPSLTTDWQKFTYTVDIGSVSGKTLGSNNDHSLWVGFQVSDTNTGTIEIAQFQVEAGSAATPFEHRSFGDDLARCQRYYEKSYDTDAAPGSSTFNGVNTNGGFTNMAAANYATRGGSTFKVSKRAQPTVVTYDSAGNSGKCNYPDNTTNQSFTVIHRGFQGFTAETSTLSSGTDTRCYWHWTADSEL